MESDIQRAKAKGSVENVNKVPTWWSCSHASWAIPNVWRTLDLPLPEERGGEPWVRCQD